MFISVIIPCYNVENYIEECIVSVLNQTYQDIEIICIDNNSSDRTFDKLQSLLQKYPTKIKVLQEFKKGAPAARNKGVSIAKGEWIQFLDADDVLLPYKIECQIALISKDKNLAIISGAYFRESLNKERTINDMDEIDCFKAVFASLVGLTSANLFNRKKIIEIGGWNEDLLSSQEVDLMFRLIKVGGTMEFDFSPNTVIRERVSGQISQRNPVEKWTQYIHLRLEMLDFLRQKRPEYYEQEIGYFQYKLFNAIRTLAIYDLNIASYFFDKYIDEKLIINNVYEKSLYLRVLRIAGFKWAEKLKKIVFRKSS
ncbi:MAG: glycosyltransferase family 2 protein [Bacteroidetes bacterium]|nr:glycosyltransferase family 2 protein [Bacteroidota bacterium]